MLTKKHIKEQGIEGLYREVEGKSPEKIVAWAYENFRPDRIAFATSFGAEDQVLIDMIASINKNATVFTLDTGRLFQETYDIMEHTRLTYKIPIRIVFPDKAGVEEMVNEKGPNLFYYSVENRKLCCSVRKVRPLKRKLRPLDAWICGLRRSQSVTRNDLKAVEWDESSGLIKINPLAEWSDDDVWNYIREHRVPYNPLHEKGFPSIGCAPCTRAIKPGEDIRSGRWWWENPEFRECGLHEKQQQ